MKYNSKLNLNSIGYPFKRVLSLEALLDYWRDLANGDDKLKSTYAAKILEQLDKAPELKQPIEDLSLLKKHQCLVDSLMSIIYPESSFKKNMMASVAPLDFNPFYSSPLFDERVNFNEEVIFDQLKQDGLDWKIMKIMKGYSFILAKVYNLKLKSDIKMAFKFPNKNTGLDRYFQFHMDFNFLKVKIVGEKPELNDEDLQSLLNNPTNLELWQTKLPPEKFELHGFTTISATEVTFEEVLSSLKHILLEKKMMISENNIIDIEHKVKSYFKNPNLRIGLAALGSEKEIFMYGNKIGRSFMMCDKGNFSCANYSESIYYKAARKKQPIIIEDLEQMENRSAIENHIYSTGIRNLVVAPLFNKDELIGFFEIASPKAKDIIIFDQFKLKELVILFATAVKRTLDDHKTEIQSIIQEKFTAIHPAIEWKFERAAMNLIRDKKQSKSAEVEPILFEQVYPLYGVSDIRDSSFHRNRAIQTDLTNHLKMAKEIIDSAIQIKPLPILEEMNFRVTKYISSISDHLDSGDEVEVLEFLNFDIANLFDYLAKLNTQLSELIANYNGALDPNLHSLYEQRKDYESSVRKINETISEYLEDAQIDAQKMFPHYFEKYKTDGVEHSIYIGASITEDVEYDDLYLYNLRLWQLMTFIEVVKRTNKLKPQLKIELETAHLILVQHHKLAIRFRMDEKKFDVDGTYNIRYEIMKKRIDKALIKGSEERLTQPGKISIVYSQEKEANEYRKYIEFLQSQNFLTSEIEELDLDSMQGVSGLKALRITVKLDENDKPSESKISNKNKVIKEAQHIYNS